MCYSNIFIRVNKVDKLIQGKIMRQLFDIALDLLDEITIINCAWYIVEDHVSPLNLGMTKEQI